MLEEELALCRENFKKRLATYIVPFLTQKFYNPVELKKVMIEVNDDMKKNGILPYNIAIELLNEILKLIGRPSIDNITDFSVMRSELNSINGVEFIKKFSDKFSKLGINYKQHIAYNFRGNNGHYSISLAKSIIEYNRTYKMKSVRKNIRINGKQKLISIYEAVKT